MICPYCAEEIKSIRRGVALHCGNAYVACRLITERGLTCEEVRHEFPW